VSTRILNYARYIGEGSFGAQSYIIRVHPHHAARAFTPPINCRSCTLQLRAVLGKKGSARPPYFLAPALFATLVRLRRIHTHPMRKILKNNTRISHTACVCAKGPVVMIKLLQMLHTARGCFRRQTSSCRVLEKHLPTSDNSAMTPGKHGASAIFI